MEKLKKGSGDLLCRADAKLPKIMKTDFCRGLRGFL